MVGNNDSGEEIQLDLRIQQLRAAAWHESLLMSMSDALLRALQRWITDHGYPVRSRCYISLQAVVPLPLPLTRCLGVLKYSHLCFLSINCHYHDHFSHDGLVKL